MGSPKYWRHHLLCFFKDSFIKIQKRQYHIVHLLAYFASFGTLQDKNPMFSVSAIKYWIIQTSSKKHFSTSVIFTSISEYKKNRSQNKFANLF